MQQATTTIRGDRMDVPMLYVQERKPALHDVRPQLPLLRRGAVCFCAASGRNCKGQHYAAMDGFRMDFGTDQDRRHEAAIRATFGAD